MANLKLYPYQLEAAKKLKTGKILCGGVGSGKSRTALAYYYLQNGGDPSVLTGNSDYFPMGDPPRDLYIITTAHKRDTLEWEGELAPFLMSTNPKVNLYVNTIVVDSWNNIRKYTKVHGAFFIFDEQRVSGSGVWVKSFLNIARKNQWILLSATPGDCWSDYIPVFIANGFYKNKTEFSREHIVYSRFTKYPKIDRYIETGKLMRLRNDILVDMDFDRKTVSHHQDLFADVDKDMCKNVMKTRWNPWTKKPIKNASELCYLLRKITNMDSSRQELVLNVFKVHSKVIIFYNFDYELDILKKVPYGKDVEIAEWNGHEHQQIPSSKKWVYLVQYAAGNEGWNCIQTDTIIFYSQNYSYRVMVQASGRIDRLNTPYTDLYYFHIKSYSSIDLAIARALKCKKNFNEGNFANW